MFIIKFDLKIIVIKMIAFAHWKEIEHSVCVCAVHSAYVYTI